MGKGFLYPVVLSAVFLVTLGASALAGTAAPHAGTSVGTVDFQISCTDDSQARFNRALALMHHMMYAQSRGEFETITARDPGCAMAFWGVAMTHFHPLWAPPSENELRLGLQAVERALELNAPTEREQAFIMAVKVLYEDWENTGHGDRIAAWNTAQEGVYRSYPDDFDATAFYALSILAAAPKSDTTFAEQKRAGAILEELHRKAPEHPAGYHYLIHAYDNPLLAGKAVDVARAYHKIAPDVPHALHMPTHIFVRLGLWADVASWNTRSAAAALKLPVKGATSLHYAHAMDYLVYANLQIGADGKALDALNEMNEIDNYQDSFASAYALAAAGGRYVLERSKWEEAAKFSLDEIPAFPWERHPQFEAIVWFSRGVGAARSGNPVEAGEALARLDILYRKTVESGQQYWATIVDSYRQTVDAWKTYAEGNGAEALMKMSRSADLEDSVDKHPVTPGAVLPARELFGDMLLLEKKYSEAIEAYEASLKISANRLRSIYGAARAGELASLDETAGNYYGKLMEVAGDHGADRLEVKAAKTFLE